MPPGAYVLLVGKPEGKRPLGKMDLGEVGLGVMNEFSSLG
jgi:hypothetical protein